MAWTIYQTLDWHPLPSTSIQVNTLKPILISGGRLANKHTLKKVHISAWIDVIHRHHLTQMVFVTTVVRLILWQIYICLLTNTKIAKAMELCAGWLTIVLRQGHQSRLENTSFTCMFNFAFWCINWKQWHWLAWGGQISWQLLHYIGLSKSQPDIIRYQITLSYHKTKCTTCILHLYLSIFCVLHFVSFILCFFVLYSVFCILHYMICIFLRYFIFCVLFFYFVFCIGILGFFAATSLHWPPTVNLIRARWFHVFWYLIIRFCILYFSYFGGRLIVSACKSQPD